MDVPNTTNLPSNNEKLSLPFKKASYTVALALAKQCRPFDDGNFFLNFTTDALSSFRRKMSKSCIITRKTVEISKYIYNAAKNRLINCKYFSISLDESTDINNICQFLIYIKAIDANLNCFEEIFEVVSLHGHVTGQVLFDAIDSKVFSIVDKNKFNLLRGNKSNERQKCGSVRNFEQK